MLGGKWFGLLALSACTFGTDFPDPPAHFPDAADPPPWPDATPPSPDAMPPSPDAMPPSPDGMLQPPLASAGADQSEHTTDTISLSGAASSSPRAGATLTYSWSFVSKPGTSAASLANATTETPSFVADRNGTYVVQLIVHDGTLASLPDTVSITTGNAAPAALAGADQNFYGPQTISLSASSSYDPDGDDVTYAWTLTGRPAGSSAALSSQAAVDTTFAADVEGTYTVSLVVTDSLGAQSTDAVAAFHWHPLVALGYPVTDAELSESLDKLVLLSGSVLHIVDPVTGVGDTVDLPLDGAAVSVSPDGQYAAVGHDAWVSHVRLSDATLLATHAVPAPTGDVVLAGNGYAYVFPSADQWVSLHSVRMSDGQLSATFNVIREDTVARLHPGGTSMYGANNGLSPSDIEKYSIAGGPASRLYDSPYHGDYPMCGNLWITDDGGKILTRCGRAFWSTNVQATDMIYAGSIPVALIRAADHEGAAGAFAVVPMSFGSGGDGTLRIYEDAFLTLEGSRGPTRFIVGNGTVLAEIGFVFFSPDRTDIYTVAVPPGGGHAGLSVWAH